jgi:hypothetical protein
MRRFIMSGILLAQCALAQTPGSFIVRGTVEHRPETDVTYCSVEFAEAGSHARAQRVSVSAEGEFEFRSATSGEWEVRLLDGYGNVLQVAYEPLNPGSSITLTIPERSQSGAPGGAVDVTQLHPVDRKALHEFQSAEKADAHGDVDRAMEHLHKAVQLDPKFAAAHQELGVHYANSRSFEPALAEFTEALRLNPHLTIAHVNRSVMLFELRRFEEAEAEGRLALHQDGSLTKAHYIVGISMLEQKKGTPEALEHLKQAYGEYANARKYGEQLERFLAAAGNSHPSASRK